MNGALVEHASRFCFFLRVRILHMHECVILLRRSSFTCALKAQPECDDGFGVKIVLCSRTTCPSSCRCFRCCLFGGTCQARRVYVLHKHVYTQEMCPQKNTVAYFAKSLGHNLRMRSSMRAYAKCSSVIGCSGTGVYVSGRCSKTVAIDFKYILFFGRTDRPQCGTLAVVAAAAPVNRSLCDAAHMLCAIFCVNPSPNN